MNEPLDEVQTSITSALADCEPLQRWARIDEIEILVEQALKRERARVAHDLHAELQSWQKVGDQLGLTAQRAWQISRGRR